jgi:hypothetical protein
VGRARRVTLAAEGLIYAATAKWSSPALGGRRALWSADASAELKFTASSCHFWRGFCSATKLRPFGGGMLTTSLVASQREITRFLNSSQSHMILRSQDSAAAGSSLCLRS